MTQLSLEQFLAREADAGQAQESGSFTIEIGSALEKMRRYRFEDPITHLLYLARSATVAGGRDLQISSKDDRLGLRFFVDEPGRYGEQASLVKALAQVEIEDSLNSHLTMALQASLSLCPKGGEWVHIRGRKRETLWCGPDGVHVQRKFTAHADPLESEFRFLESTGVREAGKLRNRVPFIKKFFQFLASPDQKFLERSASLTRRLQVVPMGLHYEYGHPVARIGGINKRQVLLLAGKRVLQRGFWVQKNPAYQTYLDPAGEETNEPKSHFARCFHYLTESEEKTTLHWVLEGVVLESEELESTGPHFEAWVSADGLSTDLSGFKLLKGEALKTRVAEIQELARNRLFKAR